MGQQFLMRADLRDPAMIDDDDPVRAPRSVLSRWAITSVVRPLRQHFERRLDLQLRLRVD